MRSESVGLATFDLPSGRISPNPHLRQSSSTRRASGILRVSAASPPARSRFSTRMLLRELGQLGHLWRSPVGPLPVAASGAPPVWGASLPCQLLGAQHTAYFSFQPRLQNFFWFVSLVCSHSCWARICVVLNPWIPHAETRAVASEHSQPGNLHVCCEEADLGGPRRWCRRWGAGVARAYLNSSSSTTWSPEH